MQRVKTEHSEHEKFFRYGQCLYRQSKYALPGRQKTEHQWGRKDTGRFVAAVFPKQKLPTACFGNPQPNGLYEHCFILCRGLLICCL